jgi:hypothetical protein
VAVCVSNLALPAAALYLSLDVPVWKVIVLFQPDLGHWLDAAALALFFKGLLGLALLGRVFGRTRKARALAPNLRPPLVATAR